MILRTIKILSLSAALLVAMLLVSVYYALRSTHFVKKYLIPWVSSSVGAHISVDEIDIRLFRGISVKSLRYNCQTEGTSCPPGKPLALYIGSLAFEYSPWAIFKRQVHITSLDGKGIRVFSTSSSQRPEVGSSEKKESFSQPEAISGNAAFSVQLSNVSLEDGFFIFQTAGGKGAYKLDKLVIKIPHANSHGESKLAIDSIVTVQTPSLTFANQEISLAGELSQSELFKPSELKLKIAAGSPNARFLELAGNLTFSKAPYSLEKINLQQSTIRDGLLRALSISAKPLREFEYAIKGYYAFSSPADASMDIQVKKNILSTDVVHDLKGSKVSSKFIIKTNIATLTDTSLEIVDNGAQILQTSAAGDLAFDPYKDASNLTLHSRFIDFGALRALISNSASNENTSKGQREQVSAAVDAGAVKQQQLGTGGEKLPLGKLEVLVDKAVIQKQETSKLKIDIGIPNSRTIDKASVEAVFTQGGTVSVLLNGSLDRQLSFKTQAREVNMIPFAALASGPHGELLEGSLKSADVQLTAQGSDIRKTLDGDATIKIARMIVPSTLQAQVPFNILFIPLDALITVFGGTLNLLLPPSISSISDSIRQTLDDAGRLGLDASAVDLKFEKGKIIMRNVDINTKNLPDFTFKGSISPDDRLDLTVFMGLMKLNLPLPISGTLESPLPDVMYLGPELVRGLGLSMGNIAGSLVGRPRP